MVVEVLSPATRANDLGVKRELYLASGARELWLADPGSRTITLLRPGSDGAVALGPAATLCDGLLDGFELDLTTLF